MASASCSVAPASVPAGMTAHVAHAVLRGGVGQHRARPEVAHRRVVERPAGHRHQVGVTQPQHPEGLPVAMLGVEVAKRAGEVALGQAPPARRGGGQRREDAEQQGQGGQHRRHLPPAEVVVGQVDLEGGHAQTGGQGQAHRGRRQQHLGRRERVRGSQPWPATKTRPANPARTRAQLRTAQLRRQRRPMSSASRPTGRNSQPERRRPERAGLEADDGAEGEWHGRPSEVRADERLPAPGHAARRSTAAGAPWPRPTRRSRCPGGVRRPGPRPTTSPPSTRTTAMAGTITTATGVTSMASAVTIPSSSTRCITGRSDDAGPRRVAADGAEGGQPRALGQLVDHPRGEAVHHQAGPASLGDGVEAHRDAGVDDERHDPGPTRAEGSGQAPHPERSERQRAEDEHGAQQAHGAEEQVAEGAQDAQQRRDGRLRAEADVAVAAEPLVQQGRGMVGEGGELAHGRDAVGDELATAERQHHQHDQPRHDATTGRSSTGGW